LPSALAEKDGAARRAAADVCLTIRIAQKEGRGGGNPSTNSPTLSKPPEDSHQNESEMQFKQFSIFIFRPRDG